MFTSPIVAMVVSQFIAGNYDFIVFYIEWIAIGAFSLFWLMKGRELHKSKADEKAKLGLLNDMPPEIAGSKSMQLFKLFGKGPKLLPSHNTILNGPDEVSNWLSKSKLPTEPTKAQLEHLVSISGRAQEGQIKLAKEVNHLRALKKQGVQTDRLLDLAKQLDVAEQLLVQTQRSISQEQKVQQETNK